MSDHATGFPPLAVRSLTPLVLIVDDEPDQVEMYQLALKLSGFDVMAASTGTDAISRARAARPAVIVLDLRLPDMTGWDVCGALKTDSLTEQIPIILLTAAVTSTLPQEARAAGCAEYLLKPCFPDHLARTVREVIATHQQA